MCGQPTDMGCFEDGEWSFAGEIQTISLGTRCGD